ncbi:hypothetical protein [Corallococcus aberystwythensis]|uniref:Secreted protein n=1 Tax=Corallococcus aberystwythensis TaxID=2316722 RepID=A0A3A8QVY6_9BACT|nr:hypothetical protein [Corallococcus aberystwythensis]RKH68982.1 hypothetical protein D7W81_11790 [Corallococcus aberystwythensis]
MALFAWAMSGATPWICPAVASAMGAPASAVGSTMAHVSQSEGVGWQLSSACCSGVHVVPELRLPSNPIQRGTGVGWLFLTKYSTGLSSMAAAPGLPAEGAVYGACCTVRCARGVLAGHWLLSAARLANRL